MQPALPPPKTAANPASAQRRPNSLAAAVRFAAVVVVEDAKTVTRSDARGFRRERSVN